jgi:hypothetical protein
MWQEPLSPRRFTTRHAVPGDLDGAPEEIPMSTSLAVIDAVAAPGHRSRRPRFAYAADAVLRVPLAGPICGAEAIRRHQCAIEAAFADAATTVITRIRQGATTAVEWEFTGLHIGPFTFSGGVVPPTGKHVTVRGASFLRHAPDGRIVEERRFYDVWSALDQLGL